MDIRIFAGWWQREGKKPVIKIMGRESNRMKHIITVRDFEPYFYVETDREPDTLSMDLVPVKRVYAGLPSHVPYLRMKYRRTWEADILFHQRFFIDRKIYSSISVPSEDVYWFQVEPCDPVRVEPRIAYIDIEVVTRGKLEPPERASWPIISIQVLDSYTKNVHVFTTIPEGDVIDDLGVASDFVIHRFEYEEYMLRRFAEWFGEVSFDMLYGWNISEYDVPYIVNRARKLNISISAMSPANKVSTHKITGVPIIDMYKIYESWTRASGSELSSFTLKNVLKYETGREYADLGPFISRYVLEKKYSELITYMIKDVEALYLIDQSTKMTQTLMDYQDMTGADWEDLWKKSKLIAAYIYRIRPRPLPTKMHNENVRYPGALVLEPRAGLHRYVAVFDFKSLYPSIIKKFKISPDPEKMLLPKTVDDFMQKREELRQIRLQLSPDDPMYEDVKRRERVAKALANSVYGALGYSDFVLYNPDLAAEVTRRGREILKKAIEFIESKFKVEVIYGDTDSLFVKVGLGWKWLAPRIEKALNDWLNDDILKIKWEKLYESIFFKSDKMFVGVKKKYVGKLIWKDGHEIEKIDIVGFETVRSDVCEYTREALKEFFEKLLYEGPDAAMAVYVKRRREFTQQPPGKVGIPKGLRKLNYKIDNPWIRGVREGMKLGWIYDAGTKPLLIYTTRGPLCLPDPDFDLPQGYEVNWRLQREKAFDEKFKDLVKTLKIRKQTTLDRWA